MTAKSHLDITGNFRQHSFAELLVEVAQANISGCLRVTARAQKSVVYMREGRVVYAVSNSRSLRLFNVLLERRRIEQSDLRDIPDIANDIELGAELLAREKLTPEQLDEITKEQIAGVIVDTLKWKDGEWHFSPLARAREDLSYDFDVFAVLADYARCLPTKEVVDRFRSVSEAFEVNPVPTTTAVLQAHEKYALDRFQIGKQTLHDLRSLSTLPEGVLLQAIYVLWLGGYIVRQGWNSALTPAKVEEIRNARIALVKQAANVSVSFEKPAGEPETTQARLPQVENVLLVPEIELSLEDYLLQVENAETLYDVLALEPSASVTEIKHAYFARARLFHPDRYHREEADKLRRIEVAFTEIARAYETLKLDDSREAYNAKIERELLFREKRKAAEEAAKDAGGAAAGMGLENFEKGLEAIAEEEYAAAAGHLARAVHYNGSNALYRAYFGHALSRLQGQRHKADAELQAAVKLAPKDAKIRLLLVDFLLEMKMIKRATGEMKRFLELVPGHREVSERLAEIDPAA